MIIKLLSLALLFLCISIHATTIVNNVHKKDLGYSKMFMTYYPSQFAIAVNGKTLNEGQSISILDESQVELTYTYEWRYLWFKRQGKKRITFEIPADNEKHAIRFNGWNNSKRFTITNARQIGSEQIVYCKGDTPPSK